MTLQSITARFECDICGDVQEVYMDPALEVNGTTMADAAEYSAREDLLDVEIDDESKFTCGTCLRKLDAEDDVDEDGNEPFEPANQHAQDGYVPEC